MDQQRPEATPRHGEAPTGPATRFSAGAGAALGALTRAVTELRGARPLHPDGATLRATVVRHGSARPTGARWLDEPGVDRGIARLSRSVGLPVPLPDVQGLALRLDGADGPSDLLLSTTGLGRVSRFLLAPHRAPSGGAYGSLLPYRTPAGPVLLVAVPGTRVLPTGLEELARELAGEPWHLRLGFASPWSRRWHAFGELVVDGPAQATVDSVLRFDAALHPLPGLPLEPWAARLREPSYAAARTHHAS
ncbi:hypothetical protein [Cellulomonas cellasea]|uniref:Phosphodiesterase n=2 Tax=Cellulomonas cellasea TaxID=43670 RepID=A0A0A0B5N8_9CELL|nr:hypothetical protein [Cellulomonas cellasea]KGM02170.1 hypothetical protein Q760_15170 [Cellulomonas cellasea DSM 20118]GEA88676.1 hypothetical protein CCE01nite_26250 [Cellulomonas cellasea]